MLGNIDLTVNPCDDFYEFACGKYDAEHEDKIPGFKSSVAFAWDQAEKDIREKEVAILKADRRVLVFGGTDGNARQSDVHVGVAGHVGSVCSERPQISTTWSNCSTQRRDLNEAPPQRSGRVRDARSVGRCVLAESESQDRKTSCRERV